MSTNYKTSYIPGIIEYIYARTYDRIREIKKRTNTRNGNLQRSFFFARSNQFLTIMKMHTRVPQPREDKHYIEIKYAAWMCRSGDRGEKKREKCRISMHRAARIIQAWQQRITRMQKSPEGIVKDSRELLD